MDSGNIKSSDSHRLFFNIPDKIDLRRKDKHVALSNVSINYTQKNVKNS